MDTSGTDSRTGNATGTESVHTVQYNDSNSWSTDITDLISEPATDEILAPASEPASEPETAALAVQPDACALYPGQADMIVRDDGVCICSGDHPLFATHDTIDGVLIAFVDNDQADYGCMSCPTQSYDQGNIHVQMVPVDGADVVFNRSEYPNRTITSDTHCCPPNATRNLDVHGESNTSAPCVCKPGFVWLNTTCSPCAPGTEPGSLDEQITHGWDGRPDYQGCLVLEDGLMG
jgi:hypothetical protein